MNHLSKLFFFLKENTSNEKTGPIAALKTSMNTCPDSCQWKENGCYAKYGPIVIHWRKLHLVGINFETVCKNIRRLVRGEYLRLFEAGDCPGDGKYTLYKKACIELSKSCKHLIAFGYSHYRPNKNNLPIFKEMNKNCTVNLSADNLTIADKYFKTGLPVVAIIPKDSPNVFYTEDGNKVIKCPHAQILERDAKGHPTRRKVKNCMNCAKGSGKGPLCFWQDRDFIVGFEPHGSGAKYLNEEMENFEFEETNTNFVGVMS